MMHKPQIVYGGHSGGWKKIWNYETNIIHEDNSNLKYSIIKFI